MTSTHEIDALVLEARTLMKAAHAGREGAAALARADACLRRVLELDRNHIVALLLWSDWPRFAGDAAGAVCRFSALLDRFPECDAAHFYLAVILLPEHPEQALVHFSAAERLATDNADYPLGCARALLALGRHTDARAALARGRWLAPDHPLAESLEARIDDAGGVRGLYSRRDDALPRVARAHGRHADSSAVPSSGVGLRA